MNNFKLFLSYFLITISVVFFCHQKYSILILTVGFWLLININMYNNYKRRL